MKFLLDSTVAIALLRREQAMQQRIRAHAPGEAAMSSVVAHELFFGAYRSSRTQANLSYIEDLQLPVLDFNWEDARRSGELRAQLAAAGTPIGPYDTLIAGQALARNLILVTHNTREFQRVPGLQIEDWQSA